MVNKETVQKGGFARDAYLKLNRTDLLFARAISMAETSSLMLSSLFATLSQPLFNVGAAV
jgi:hypothetical protein